MSAVISACGTYRYSLTRNLGMGDRVVTFIGVNPSTADATTDDATVRKWCGFAKRWGFDRIEVVNLFAYRATDVRALAEVEDPVGPANNMQIRAAIDRAQLVVPCWGSRAKLPPRLVGRIDLVRVMLRVAGVELKCFGKTQQGDPRHPLMLGYDTALEQWP